ncbi:MAG: hypothetical protein KBS52_06810 [Clostridiales bacterium]|nr:hypothetical protein [Candidatus Equinaster intestinalis]
MNERIKVFLKKFQNGKTVMILGIAGILLIFLSSLLPEQGTSHKTADNPDLTQTEYLSGLEKQITAIVKRISGKNAEVVITLDTGVTYNYAAETKTSQSDKSGQSTAESEKSSEDKKTIVTDQNGSESPIIINSFLPQIRGVAVVYFGADDYNTNERIASALKAALSVSSNQIFIYGNGG